MPHFSEIKKRLHENILAAVKQGGSLDRRKTIASYSLSTGLSEKLIEQMIDQMDAIGEIRIEGQNITREE